ncbi:MAG: hypothetical protein DWQ34_06770 [Planctomycetota bacterium]|nr:MAG: hypothetical protein DWQ34_06770 [Planctomycetota bacterium]REK25070.1 MAG: hypothetical protein DWQ41_12920 [Planctomycetota bacterium]REK28135.1 MAG: hypothetical protein DWQ45_25245 [Planctomycetota bacterium]
MPKKTKRQADQPPLTHYWTPPETIIDGGVGAPCVCLATTYEFDAPFFEAELLPRFLGLKFDETENESSFLVEREEALALASVSVLVDHSRFDSTQTTLRWDQLPIQIPGGIQHAKITILGWERLTRLIIGSANLTRSGYRKNREVFAALDFWNDPDSVPLQVLRDSLALINLMLDWSRAAPKSVERARERVRRFRRRARGWRDAPADFTPLERPRVALAATHPARDGQKPRSALGDVFDLWGKRPAQEITVVTPFTAPDPDATQGDPVINRFGDLKLSSDCAGWLVTPELPTTPDDPRMRVPFPEVFGHSWSQMFDSRGGANVNPLPLCVEDREDRNRALHTKCISIENFDSDVVLMMIGSSNFTPRGMGLGTYNFEANLAFQDRAKTKRDGMRLVDRLRLPVEWDDALEVDDVVWQTPDELAEDEPEPVPVLPAFFGSAAYSQTEGVITLQFDPNQEQPVSWTVRLPEKTAESPILFSSRTVGEGDGSQALTFQLPEAMRGVNVVALVVEWEDEQGNIHHAKLGVTVESEAHLLPAEQFLKLNADTIIDCLISGKSPAQWFDQQNRKQQSTGTANDAAVESLKSVDTSAYLLFRVRRFGRALTGMAQRIQKTVPLPGAIRYRLLKDPFGPLSLARLMTSGPRGETSGWCATLDSEHKAFLLAEVLLTVMHLQPKVARKAGKKDRTAITESFDSTIQELQQIMRSVIGDNHLPDNLRTYIDHMLSDRSDTLNPQPQIQNAG